MLRLLNSVVLFAAIVFTNCTAARQYDFSLKDTLSIFLVNNEKGSYFCIPVQYMGEYQINSFEFDSGYVKTGDYEIPLNREEINIYVYYNETNEELVIPDRDFDLIYSEEKGRVITSKMSEQAGAWNYYYIFIEKRLNNDDVKKITKEYEKGNVSSKACINYDLIIDNEPQPGNGMLDDFELYNGSWMDPALYPQNLDFFKEKYLDG
jgi:hypothetical protein